MSFLNIPLKTIELTLVDALGIETMPWYDPTSFPVPPGQPYPAPLAKDFRWKVTLDAAVQQQSSHITRSPGIYNGQDVAVGQWIANASSGQAWQIISIESKSNNRVIAIVQDVYRYNTFRDTFKQGNGAPGYGSYIAFTTSDAGLPQIDPIPESGVSSVFSQNLMSRFEYINLQYDYPLYQENNNFAMNDVIAADANTNSFVLADSRNKFVIGRVTSISDTIPGWFTINPVQKIVDNLNYLPGNVGDIIYSSTTVPGGITTDTSGSQIYISLRKNTSSISYNTLPGPSVGGNVFQLNEINITVSGTGAMEDVVSSVNAEISYTGVEASKVLTPNSLQTTESLYYGEILLWAKTSPALVTINGVNVIFDIVSTTLGYEDYSQSVQLAKAINRASIPDITATSPNPQTLIITNEVGGAINIVNISSDVNGVNFAGTNSGSGLLNSKAASTEYKLKFVAVDARPINFLDVVGSTVEDFGLVSVENGIKASGLYIEEGIRQVNSSVVPNLAQLNTLQPIVGDQAYVIDAGHGEWANYVWDGSAWLKYGNQRSENTDARTLVKTLDLITSTAGQYSMGTVSTGRKIIDVSVEVTNGARAVANDAISTISVGTTAEPELFTTAYDSVLLGNATYHATTNYVTNDYTDVSITLNKVAGASGTITVKLTYV